MEPPINDLVGSLRVAVVLLTHVQDGTELAKLEQLLPLAIQRAKQALERFEEAQDEMVQAPNERQA